MPRPKGTHTAIESYMLINGKIGDVNQISLLLHYLVIIKELF